MIMPKLSKRDRKKESFAGIPRHVMNNQDYKSLSGNAVKLLLELAKQYKGNNNGDLTVAYALLKDRGFNSKSTITRCRNELLSAHMITQTRAGRFMNPKSSCSLYALTWKSIDECGGKLEVKPTIIPPRQFSLENNKTPRPEIGLGSSSKVGRERKKDSKGRYVSSSKVGRLVAVT
jgi:hypothetical protein